MRIIQTILLTLVTLALQAAPQASAIQALIDQHFPDGHVGVFVQDASTGQVLVDINGDEHFTPASTAKMFTAYAALKTLGPDFTFTTRLLQDPQKTLYIQFSGDPSFSTDDLATFVDAIKAAGISQIDGPIVLDASIIPAPYYARGWVQDDLPWYYAAPVHGAVIDENKISMQLMPRETPNQTLTGRITSTPPLPVSSNVKSATEYDANHLCQLDAFMDQHNHLNLYGCWPIGKEPVGLMFAVTNPIKRVAQILSAQLQSQGIAFSGEIKEGKTPANAVSLMEHTSEPLPILLDKVLGHSSNIYTEALGKQIGLKEYHRATFQAGAFAIERICYDTLTLAPNSIELSDASGLSNYNLSTPHALAAVLKEAHADPMMRPILLNTLARSGTKGTLTARMATQDLKGRFIGKTGAMGHLFNVAGYLFKSPEKTPLIVVIMVNETSEKKSTMHSFEIALMRHLLKNTI